MTLRDTNEDENDLLSHASMTHRISYQKIFKRQRNGIIDYIHYITKNSIQKIFIEVIYLRICIVGEFQGNIDEGMKNVSISLIQELSHYHDVIGLTTNDVKNVIFKNPSLNIFSSYLRKRIGSFRPETIHYIPYSAATFSSFIRAKVLSIYSKNAKVILSALQPRKYSSFSKKIIPLVKPDLVLVQSLKSEKKLNKLECKTKFFPNGVNIEKFSPVDIKLKKKLRVKYGLDQNKFIILHVGHLKRKRNVSVLSDFKNKDNIVILITSTSSQPDQDIIFDLQDKGVIVWNTYFEKIEEIFQLSDCYVFPTKENIGSIEIPLSVMEAMACNLPVVSTKFGALSRIFSEEKGFYFVEKVEDFFNK